MKTKIIYNPAASKGIAIKRLPYVKSLLEELQVEYDLEMTREQGHAFEIARKATTDGFEIIAAAGGDGTANEVLNGIMRGAADPDSRPVFAVLCVGRGNDLAYGAGIPTVLKEGCEALAHGIRHRIDL